MQHWRNILTPNLANIVILLGQFSSSIRHNLEKSKMKLINHTKDLFAIHAKNNICF